MIVGYELYALHAIYSFLFLSLAINESYGNISHKMYECDFYFLFSGFSLNNVSVLDDDTS